MGWLSDVFKFEKFNLKGMGKQIKDNPARLLYGATDPFSTGMWNKVLGRDDQPLTDQWGGAAKQRYGEAENAGIDAGPGHDAHRIARIVTAAMFAGGAMGGGGGGAGGAGGAGGGGFGGMGGGMGGGMPGGMPGLGGGQQAPKQNVALEESEEMLKERRRQELAELIARQQLPQNQFVQGGYYG